MFECHRIFVYKLHDGETSIFCNVSSWYVDPMFRNYAALLASMAQRRKDVTYFNVTPDVSTWPILEARGFMPYCRGLYFSVPVLSRTGRGMKVENLGWAGGIDVWIDRLLPISGWEGIWILNPDAEPEPGALRALVECAVAGNKGMVGSTIVPPLTATTFIAVPAIAGVSYGPTLPLSALGSQSMDRSISRRSRRLSIALPVDRCMSREHVSGKSVRWMNDFFCFTTTPTGPSAQSRMVWGMRVTLLCRTGEAQRSDRSDSALKDPGSQCISKAEIISTSFACIGTGICSLRSCWDAWT